MLRCFAFFPTWLLWAVVPLGAQTSTQPTAGELNDTLKELKNQFEQMKSDYEMRIAELERKLIQFSASESSAPSSSAPQDATLTGGERTLQALNPEISVTGDATARFSDNSGSPGFNRLNFDGFELAIQHPLDSFSQARFSLIREEEEGHAEFDIEEGYISWESLPGNLGLKVGRFHTNFGKLNLFHKHALPWADRDLPTLTLFGEEGLRGNGISLTWLPPKLPIGHSNEVSFEVINNSTDLAFSGKGFGDPLYVGSLQSYYDLTENAYFEWGLSGATSHWDLDEQNRSTVWGLDFSYRWEPLQPARYRSLELASELFYNARERWPGGNVLKMYAYGEYQFARRWSAGLRYQFGEDIDNNADHQWTLTPYATFWQSERVRLRAQYDFLNKHLDNNENRFLLQFTWTLGPHKHDDKVPPPSGTEGIVSK